MGDWRCSTVCRRGEWLSGDDFYYIARMIHDNATGIGSIKRERFVIARVVSEAISSNISGKIASGKNLPRNDKYEHLLLATILAAYHSHKIKVAE